jgi:hypothetical protein
MSEIKKIDTAFKASRELSAQSPIFKSQEAPAIITGKLPETPKRPPPKKSS